MEKCFPKSLATLEEALSALTLWMEYMDAKWSRQNAEQFGHFLFFWWCVFASMSPSEMMVEFCDGQNQAFMIEDVTSDKDE